MKLIKDWKKAWRYYTVWGLAALMALPDLYNLLSYTDIMYYMPEKLAWIIRTLAFLTLVGRFIDQNRPDAPKTPDESGA